MILDVTQTFTSISNLRKPIFEIDLGSDFEMEEEIRPLIHQVNFKLFKIILNFPI